MEGDFVKIPRYLVGTLCPEGYFGRVLDMIHASGFDSRTAFEAIEGERSAFGLPKGYDNFESFKRSRYYHTRKRLVRISA